MRNKRVICMGVNRFLFFSKNYFSNSILNYSGVSFDLRDEPKKAMGESAE